MSFSEQPEQPPRRTSPPDPTVPARPGGPAETVPGETDLGETTVTVHRAPRYKNFMILGAILGVAFALALTVAFPENPTFDRAQVFGFLLLGGVAAGVAIGCLVALAFDRLGGRSPRTVVADRLGVTDTRAVSAPDDASDTQHSNEKSE